MMQGVGGAALAPSIPTGAAAPAPRKWPIEEGPDTPKISLSAGDGGGPLPAALQPPAAPQAGRGAGGFGGFLAPGTAPAPAAEEAPGGSRGLVRNLPAAYRRVRQLGVTHLIGVPVGNWTEESIRSAIRTAKDVGLVAYNSMINLPASVIYGRESRAKDMEPFIASIEAAGKAGLPVVEYNFFAHRAIEGYYETVGRAGAGYTGFDY
ncbi:MAG: hypothetical protein ABSH45_08095, partial [Bryobacteraceae bacterium]